MPAKVETSLLYPLSEFYEAAGTPLPAVSRVESADLPQPYRCLLAHDRDMTPTLEANYGQPLHLRVLQYKAGDDVVSRQVVLVLEDETIVAFGSIHINLQYFPAEAKRLVVERKVPLGTILRVQGMAHQSRPAFFFRVTADDVINKALGLSGAHVLYGRQNLLLDSAGQTLAQVIEILPPEGGPSREQNHG